MLDALKKLFGFGPHVNYKELINQGAQVIDVRTPGEFKNGLLIYLCKLFPVI
jgi:tRNA 2-selenouridine synthase SelU